MKRIMMALACLVVIGLGAFFLGGPHFLMAEKVSPDQDKRAVMVLNYHMVTDRNLSLAVPPADFEKEMQYLQKYGFVTITPEELYDFITEGAELPEKPLMITFDDGYEDNYTNAFPILKKYGFKATIFAVTGMVGVKPNYLTWEQAKEMTDAGFSIESHTVNHIPMTQLSEEQLTKELVESKSTIEEKLGTKADFVAYPTGTYNLLSAELVQAAGYKGAFTIKYDTVDRTSNVYAIERVPVFHTGNTNKDFLERIHYLPLFREDVWDKN